MKDLSSEVAHQAEKPLPDLQLGKEFLRPYLDAALEREYEFAAWLASRSVARYALAFSAVGVALLLRWLLRSVFQDVAPFATLYVAVALAAWYCGTLPALTAMIAGVLGVDYWLLQPTGSLLIANRGHLANLVVFTLTSLVMVTVAQANRRNLSALKELRGRLEERIGRRTTELERANGRMKEQAERLELAIRKSRRLTAQLLEVQDEERRRIARDLHDSTGQTLAYLVISLSLLQKKIEGVSRELGSEVAESVELAKQVSADLRTTSYLLHPPMLDEMGLAPALRCYVEGLRRRSRVQVTLQLVNELGRLPKNCETAIFRIVQAALTNIQLHSGSETALIQLGKSAENVQLIVKDQGKGIPPEELSQMVQATGALGLGLRGIRERVEDLGGRFDIASGEKGTEITVIIPVPTSRAAAC